MTTERPPKKCPGSPLDLDTGPFITGAQEVASSPDNTLPDVAPGLPPVPFEPTSFKRTNAQATAVIEYAQRVKDWPLLEQAVEAKVEQQSEFVEWWRENVRGKGKRASVSDPRHFVEDAEGLTGITKKQVSRWAKGLADRDAYREKLYGAAWKAAMGVAYNDASIHFSSDSPEHYTPKLILDAVIACMGGIDLDPCSNSGEPNVPAARHFTEEHDGLNQEWHGRVFMNPPYGTSIGAWIRKLHGEYAMAQSKPPCASSCRTSRAAPSSRRNASK